MNARRTIEAANRDIATTNYILSGVLFVIAGTVFLYVNSKAHIDFQSGNNVPLLFFPGAFVFFGVMYLGYAILNSMRVGKWGTSFMDIDEAEYGGAVRGQIRTQRPLDVRGDYTLHLECIEHVLVSEPTKRGTTRNVDQRFVRWEVKQTVKSEGVSSTVGIPVNIKVEPFPWPKTPHSQGIHWELTIKAPLRGLNYSAVFGIQMHVQPTGHAPRG